MARDVDVLTETVIRRPVAEVAAYAGDPTNAPEWYANIDSVEWQTPPPVAVGSRIDFVARFLGRRLAYTYEVAELRARRAAGHAHGAGPVPHGDHLHLGAARRRRHADDAAQPRRARGLLAVVAPFMAAAMRRANRKDLAALRSRLETRAPVRAPDRATCPAGRRAAPRS